LSTRHRTGRLKAGASLTLAAAAVACGGIPTPPGPAPELAAPRFQRLSLSEALPAIAPPGHRPPRVRWSPAVPGEGTFAVLVLEPEARAMPVFEVQARARDHTIALTPLGGGAYFGLVAVPLSAEEIPVEVSVTLIDGARLTQRLALLVRSREFPTTRLSVASRFTAPDERALERIRREHEIVRAALGTVTGVPLWDGAFILPRLDDTTSPYGQRRLFNNELRSRHTGLDLRGATGDPVYASNSGRVVLARDLFYSGNTIYIDHGLGLFTGYFHLSKHDVTEGQWVEKGQLIGRIGATGRVTGPHLHWSLYLQGAALDPGALLEGAFARLSERLPQPEPLRVLRLPPAAR
jgi:murein DD-endopeptidase MepM/ murein hydrolase activator NlpD